MIDVLILYTPKALQDSSSETGAARTSSQLETELVTAWEEANEALVDSAVNFKIRIVHMEQVCVHVVHQMPCGKCVSLFLPCSRSPSLPPSLFISCRHSCCSSKVKMEAIDRRYLSKRMHQVRNASCPLTRGSFMPS